MTRRPDRLRIRDGRDRDDGFTLVELMIALGLSMIVMTAILGVVISQSNAERRTSNFADNQELMRQAIVALQRDIRSSEPLKQLATSPEYALRVDLNVYDDILSANPTPVRWRVDTAAKELVREELDASGNNVIATSHRLRGVENNSARPLFSFYKANGWVYTLDGPNADQPKDIAECTIRVHIDLLAAPNLGPAPTNVVSDAELRNRLPGGVGCPQVVLPPPPSSTASSTTTTTLTSGVVVTP